MDDHDKRVIGDVGAVPVDSPAVDACDVCLKELAFDIDEVLLFLNVFAAGCP